ncbi:hypothetical protein [Synechococcus sp. UW179A]|uniref:hypothetical protein n=1 Tax=Synechococcus sp. UW179A TaxID=2575510 RepID=UPI001FCB8C52|nr:hypothetical protein [Synechococcus sp. UW179A]
MRRLRKVIGMNGSIQLTTEQRFQIEQFNRALETTQDPEQLRQLARQLMQAWQTQKAATCWVLKQDMPPFISTDG